MSDRNKLKITVLKRQDPAELFETLPVAKKDWMVPCGIYEDGQEIIVEENLRMPEGFCASAWQTIYQTSGRSASAAISPTSTRRGSPSPAAPTG